MQDCFPLQGMKSPDAGFSSLPQLRVSHAGFGTGTCHARQNRQVFLGGAVVDVGFPESTCRVIGGIFSSLPALPSQMLNHSRQCEVLHSFNKPTPVLPNSARCSFFATENLSYAMGVLLKAKNFESGQLKNRLIPRLQIKGGPKGTSVGVTFVSMSKGNSGRGQPQCTWHCWWK